MNKASTRGLKTQLSKGRPKFVFDSIDSILFQIRSIRDLAAQADNSDMVVDPVEKVKNEPGAHENVDLPLPEIETVRLLELKGVVGFPEDAADKEKEDIDHFIWRCAVPGNYGTWEAMDWWNNGERQGSPFLGMGYLAEKKRQDRFGDVGTANMGMNGGSCG